MMPDLFIEMLKNILIVTFVKFSDVVFGAEHILYEVSAVVVLHPERIALSC